MLVGITARLLVRVHDRQGVRQRVRRLVVVSDNGVDAQLTCQCDLLHCRAAAVDRYKQSRALPGELANGLAVEPVAFSPAVGNVGRDVQPQRNEECRQQSSAGYPVDVVVAVHGNLFIHLDGPDDTTNGNLHARQQVGVVKIVKRWRQKLSGHFGVRDAAIDQDLAEEGR